ncbi:transmembrane protein 265 isoform X2 [Engystomops pustulosus]|uniref:transmembrane protein 265 isoform X2 n=1 Tax=Engystomops pustulosus TaxID=76066 RepID=UPI003AFB016D
MTEGQQLQVRSVSEDPKLQNGATGEDVQILVSTSREDARQEPRKTPRYLPPCNPRRLAIISIVCGVSCCGIKALILALQAEQEGNKEISGALSRRSRKFSVLSILLFVGILVSLPFLLVLVSYLMTLIE